MEKRGRDVHQDWNSELRLQVVPTPGLNPDADIRSAKRTPIHVVAFRVAVVPEIPAEVWT